LDGTKILREGWNYDEVTKTYRDVLIPLYDNEDSVCGIIYNNVPYYFQKNLQGDVIGITNEHGTVVGAYRYDAWGANTGIITCTELTDGVDIANINPFRYRSYYFDDEIEMYYLQSRYYDSATGRFVNADNPSIAFFIESLNYDLYGYCDNNPIADYDASGYASYRTRSKTLNKLIEALEKAIPNIYTQDFWCKEKQLLRIGASNLALTISCGIAAQTNKNALFGGMFKKGTLEVSAFLGVSNYVCFSFSAGVTWRKAYIKVGLLLAMSRGWSGFYGGAYVEISVPTWLLAVATVAVGVACVYNPAVGAYIAKFIGSVRSSARAAAAVLVPIFPYVIKAAA
jgi:RHS repeat-associated protein